MEKIRMDLDTLAVESFPIDAPGAAARGTVRAHDGTQAHTCGYTCGTDVHFLCCTG
jgi:hypothetical protein